MTRSEGRPGEKFIGFFRLVDACDRPGCPVCRCLVSDARQYLGNLLYEQVTDPETRSHLYASWGFCNRHAWMLRETPDPAFGSSILGEDLLRLASRRLARTSMRRAPAARAPLARLRRLWSRRRLPVVVEIYGRRAACPACRETVASEERYLLAAIRFVDDPEFASAYDRSHGLCVPHALRALAVGAGRPEADHLVDRTLARWTELRRDLAGFIAKHDHRNIRPFTEAEGSSHLRVFETLTGAEGVFGTDAHRGGTASEPAHRTIARLRAEVERLRAALDVARTSGRGAPASPSDEIQPG